MQRKVVTADAVIFLALTDAAVESLRSTVEQNEELRLDHQGRVLQLHSLLPWPLPNATGIT